MFNLLDLLCMHLAGFHSSPAAVQKLLPNECNGPSMKTEVPGPKSKVSQMLYHSRVLKMTIVYSLFNLFCGC